MSILKANRIENLTTTDGGINVNNAGNVGIGTDSIASGGANTTNFNVHTPSATSVYLKLSNSSTGNSASDAFDLSADSSGNAYLINRENGNMTFWTNATERLRIDSSGRVGIGTSSPSSLIHGSSSGNAALTLQTSGSSNSVSTNYQSTSRTYYTGVDIGGSNSAYTVYDGTASAERMRIDSSGNVGIGVTNPSSYASNANNLVVGNTSSTNGITILTGTGNAGGINFADGTGGTDRGRLDYDHGDDRMRFYTASSERMRIDSSGNVGIGTATINRPLVVYGNSFSALSINTSSSGTAAGDGVQLQLSGSNGYLWNYENGGIHFGTNGTERMRILSSGGLTFNGDTAAANALDDYEEGTWTAAFSSGITSAGYSSQAGTYTKIGRLVTFTLHLRANSGTNAGSEQVRISGLPFTAGSSADEGGAFFNYRGNLDSGIGPFMHIGQNQNVIRWYSASGGNWVGTDGSGIKNHAFHIQGYYYAAS